MTIRKKHENDILGRFKQGQEIVVCGCPDVAEECKAKRERMLKLFRKKNKDNYVDISSQSEIYENFETFFARQESDKQ